MQFYSRACPPQHYPHLGPHLFPGHGQHPSFLPMCCPQTVPCALGGAHKLPLGEGHSSIAFVQRSH